MNETIAELIAEPRFVVVKRGLFYRPNAHGYTMHISEAWKLCENEAKKHAYPHGDDPVTIRKVPPLDYAKDLNACHLMVMSLSEEERIKYVRELRQIIARDECHRSNPDTGGILDFWFYCAKPMQRCEAFLKVKGRWEAA